MKTSKEEKSILVNYKNSVIINNLYKSELFSYRIYEDVYNEIINGTKKVEFRLLNEKSNKIKKDDVIVFEVLHKENLSIKVKVINKYIYNNIDELWDDKDVITNNNLNLSKENFVKLFYNIYGESLVKESKIIAIQFELLDK